MGQAHNPLTSYWLPLFKASFTDPRGTAEAVESDAFLNGIAPLAIIVIIALGTISSTISIWSVGGETIPLFQFLAANPLLFAIVQFVGFILTVIVVVYVGRIFGGQAGIGPTFTLFTWLQFLSLVSQLILWPLAFLFGGLADLASAGLTAYFIWLTLVYIAAAHGFQSLFLVALVTAGCLFTLSFVLMIFATIFGFLPEPPPNV